MFAIVKSVALHGLQGRIIRVEVDVSRGLPSFDIVGLPDASVREAKDRVRAAIKNSDFEFPSKRITVNLAPADIKKEGPVYDLPIATGILAATEQIQPYSYENLVIFGELSLNGRIRGVNGILPSVMTAMESGFSRVVVPLENAREAALIQNISVYPVGSLAQFIRFLENNETIHSYTLCLEDIFKINRDGSPDMADVRGQHAARRALEVAAAGGHNILMVGSPGSGKTMLARRLPGIMPDMTFNEAIEVTQIHSLAAHLKADQPMVTTRPFRSPHHTASTVALVGGGRIPKPGEISLAHNGVLFMDEMPEFHKDALESLRQPMEDGSVTISRISSTITYPARLMLVGAMNPCPCGYFGDRIKDCNCTPHQVQRYINRISGPLLDRMDIHIEVPRIDYMDLSGGGPGEDSDVIKQRVADARARQLHRFGGKEPFCNAAMDSPGVRKYCRMDREAGALLKDAYKQLSMSARAHDQVLKVALTIADLNNSDRIKPVHIAEAVQYRSLERKYWL